MAFSHPLFFLIYASIVRYYRDVTRAQHLTDLKGVVYVGVLYQYAKDYFCIVQVVAMDVGN